MISRPASDRNLASRDDGALPILNHPHTHTHTRCWPRRSGGVAPHVNTTSPMAHLRTHALGCQEPSLARDCLSQPRGKGAQRSREHRSCNDATTQRTLKDRVCQPPQRFSKLHCDTNSITPTEEQGHQPRGASDSTHARNRPAHHHANVHMILIENGHEPVSVSARVG